MTRKIKFYMILATGIIVLLVGIISFLTSYGDTNFGGIVQQVTAVIVILGGIVNLLVAAHLKKEMEMSKKEE
ncbi:MAG: hypothetical protein JJU35_09200 [Balneolales bacterium]|nr:hypothetical protein [Balneolales bacterium]